MQDAEPKMPWEATRRGIAEAMADIDGALPGSVVVRHIPCGKSNCACKADPPTLHGPYIQWTRTVDGKTVTKLLSQDQLTRYQPWFDNARRLKELIAMLQIASVHAVERHEGWTTPAKGHRPTPAPDRIATPHPSKQSSPTVTPEEPHPNYLTPRKEDVIRRLLAHHAEQTKRAAERVVPAPAPGYRPETLDVLFGKARS